MYGDMQKIEEMKERYATVSPTFCLAKWMHATIHLMSGQTHSCYLPPTHQVPVEEVERNPRALHNSEYKKTIRKQMLEGKRPSECSICWNVEDLPGCQMSDRHYRSVEEWTLPYFEKVKSLAWDADINPSYLEISFSSTCNFKCSYCAPHVSSSWMSEIKKHGPYDLGVSRYHDLAWTQSAGLMPVDPENNPYVRAFWKWWPELASSLMYFRITGGEPLLSEDTFRVLDWLNENPQPNLNLSVNSNMGVAERFMDRFIDSSARLVRDRKIKSFALHTSLDTHGAHAEYIRHGLDFAVFEKNLRRFLTELPDSSVFFMCTFNNLSLPRFPQYLEWMMQMRNEFNSDTRKIFLDIPHLIGPRHQSVKILTPDFQDRMRDLIRFMSERQDQDRGIREREIEKMNRILAWMESPVEKQWIEDGQREFYRFFSEHDRRRGTDFLATFPEMDGFWRHCERLARTELTPDRLLDRP